MPFAVENEWKKKIALETYERIGGFVPASLECVTDGVEYGYRNKIEFSFFQERLGSDDPVQLAFFQRGQHHKVGLEDGCALASPAINATAQRVLAWIHEQQIPARSLKSLIIRSNRNGETIAGLFIKDRLPLEQFPVRDTDGTRGWLGFQVFLSNFRSPASVIDDTLYSDGATSITETVNGVRLQYGLSSFFQVNVPVFEKALADMAAAIPANSHVIDYYAGVGAISMALRERISRAELVDNNAEGIAFATENITANALQHFSAQCIPAEHMTELITEDAIVIVDPPRAGLHDDVTRVLLEKRPQRIIYLSCNLSTQARDLQRLSAAYRVSSTRVYNFFPRTPHIEGLCIFDRIAQ
jgi:tRNA/tmRNA/rRNA uracil-C5-methylase (TrmA/RlmC/RlmD family)